MYHILKFLHLIGLTMFLGSIFAHIAASALAGEPGSAGFLFDRQYIAAATQALTMPGLALAVATGLAMAMLSRLSPFRARWLAIHGVLALAVVAIAVTLVVPAGRDLLRGAAALRDGLPGADAGSIIAAKRIEDIAGAVNVLLTLVIAALGVWKPKL